MFFEDFLFMCGLSICLGLCVMFGALLGFGLFYWLRDVFTAGSIKK